MACSSDATTSGGDTGSSSGTGASAGSGSTGEGGGNTGAGGTSQGGQGGQGGMNQGGMNQGGMNQGGMNQGGMNQGGMNQGGMNQGGGGNASCTWQNGVNPCGNGFFCNAPGCGQGVCAPITVTADSLKVPVCGCDGVDYWNGATASNYGMAVMAAGMCPTPAFCGGIANLPCPSVAHFCAAGVNTAQECAISDAGGACWGMPPTCSQIGFGGSMRPCSSTNPNDACLYECDAIKSEQTYWGPDSNCPM
jgi:hypothetical protein